MERLRLRADIMAEIRTFFASREVLEVDTPTLSRGAVTSPHIESFSTRYHGPGADGEILYLHTSPEFPMKRLLAAGSGAIYQIAKVFRQGESGRRHNPEFTLLEWYRPGYDHRQLMQEVEGLLLQLLQSRRGLQASEWISYRDAFEQHVGIDPHGADEQTLRTRAAALGVGPVEGLEGLDGWLDLLMSQVVEPSLGQGRLTFLYDYPVSQAALARIRPGQASGEPDVAERFEVYYQGVELANGFHELADSVEQRRRFEAENHQRREWGMEERPLDENLLAALQQGLPDCAGVALGIDRLVMLAAGAGHIDEVIAFPLSRA